MKKFIVNVIEKAQLQEIQIRSEIAFFICNKWDEVGVLKYNKFLWLQHCFFEHLSNL